MRGEERPKRREDISKDKEAAPGVGGTREARHAVLPDNHPKKMPSFSFYEALPSLDGRRCRPSVLSSPAPAQSFAVERSKLANGMTVILSADHTLPVATINIWYRVGSKDERPGAAGSRTSSSTSCSSEPSASRTAVRRDHGGRRAARTTPPPAPTERTTLLGPRVAAPDAPLARRSASGPAARDDQKKVDLQRDVVLNELRQSYGTSPTAAPTSRSSSSSLRRPTRTISDDRQAPRT